MLKILLCDRSFESLKILSFIIERKELGEVLDEVSDGNHALELITSINPDIVITDYRLDHLDGNEVIRKSKLKGFRGKFLMVSEIGDPEVVTKAYENGASFFLKKPINVLETIHVIRQVGEMLRLERMATGIQELVGSQEFLFHEYRAKPVIGLERELDQIFENLSLNGTTGCHELKQLVLLSLEKENSAKGTYSLSGLYQRIAEDQGEKPGTIEQKIRRVMLRTMDFIAMKGLEDYDSLVFDRFASVLFDYSQIHQQILYLSGRSRKRGMLQTKKFVEGIKSLLPKK